MMRAINASCFYGIFISTIKFQEIVQNEKVDYILASINILNYNKKLKQ